MSGVNQTSLRAGQYKLQKTSQPLRTEVYTSSCVVGLKVRNVFRTLQSTVSGIYYTSGANRSYATGDHSLSNTLNF